MTEERKSVRTLRCMLTFAFGISYLANVFLASPVLYDANTLLLVVVLILSFLAAKDTSRLIALMMFLVGAGLLVFTQAPLHDWEDALQDNAFLIAMFIMVPLISIPVRHGGYLESLRYLFTQHANTKGRYYGLVSIMASFLGVLVSIASVPLTYEVARAGRFSKNTRLLGTALSRGFATCLIWSPTTATAALALSLTGANWLAFAPAAIACCLIAGAVGWLMVEVSGLKKMRESTKAREGKAAEATISHELTSANEHAKKAGVGACTIEAREADRETTKKLDSPDNIAGAKLDARKLTELIVFSSAFIGVVMAVAHLFSISVIVSVALVSLVFPILWMACIKKLPTLRTQIGNEYIAQKLPQVKGQIILFTAAGILAAGISASGIGTLLVQDLMQLIGHDVLVLTVLVLVLGVIVAGVGIHPIVYTAVIGGSLAASQVGVTPEYLALLLCATWALGNAACPTSANTIAVSQLVDCSPFKLSWNWNIPYVLVASVVVIAAMTGLHALGAI